MKIIQIDIEKSGWEMIKNKGKYVFFFVNKSNKL